MILQISRVSTSIFKTYLAWKTEVTFRSAYNIAFGLLKTLTNEALTALSISSIQLVEV